MLLQLALALVAVSAAPISSQDDASTSENLFPTDIGYLGPTSTGKAPFLAQTDNIGAIATGVPTKHYNYPNPIETSVQSFDHKDDDQNIFQMMGTLSPYFVSEDGWGVYNYALPGQCSIKQLHFVQRHGSRAPDSPFNFPERLKYAKGNGTFKAHGDLEFLNKWVYKEGVNILTTLGNNQLFNNGVKSFFRYGELFDWENFDKIVTRSTTEERMTMTAEYFLTGFFGLDWQKYADLELLIEETGFNNSLAAWDMCENNGHTYGKIGYEQIANFTAQYLSDAVQRFNTNVQGFNFTTSDLYELQKICAYETNNIGFSKFCGLFSQKEWENYGYYQSVSNYVSSSFGNPQGRALGAGWVEEFTDRLTNQTYNASTQAEQNSTLDSDPIFFPLDQSIYMDFTHDSQIVGIITALGFEQFKTNWTFKGPEQDTHLFDISKITPFAAQLAFEVIECDSKVPVDRSAESEEGSSSTKYVHAILNDNTLSLSANIPEYCESRVDGWCEFDRFVEYLNTLYGTASYDFACTGDYTYTQTVANGVPEATA